MNKLEKYFWQKLSGLFLFPNWLRKIWANRVVKDYEKRGDSNAE